MMSSAFLTTCRSKYRQEPVKIKEFFGTSYIFLIHCASLNFLFFMMLCLFHGQAIKFKLHLEGNLLHLGLTVETSHYLCLYF